MLVMRLSDSCTSGWLNWGHGELWLTQRSLVRVPRTILTLRASFGGMSTVRRSLRQEMRTEVVTQEAWRQRLARNPPSVVVDLDAVVGHRLVGGLLTSRLDVTTRGGDHHVFLWMRNPAVLPLLTRATTDLAAHRSVFHDPSEPA